MRDCWPGMELLHNWSTCSSALSLSVFSPSSCQCVWLLCVCLSLCVHLPVKESASTRARGRKSEQMNERANERAKRCLREHKQGNEKPKTSSEFDFSLSYPVYVTLLRSFCLLLLCNILPPPPLSHLPSFYTYFCLQQPGSISRPLGRETCTQPLPYACPEIHGGLVLPTSKMQPPMGIKPMTIRLRSACSAS